MKVNTALFGPYRKTGFIRCTVGIIVLMICSCIVIATQFLVRNCWSLIRLLIDVLLFGKSDLKMPVLMWSASMMQWCIFFTTALA